MTFLNNMDVTLENIVLKVLQSPRYRLIDEMLIQRIVVQEVKKRNNEREVLKAVKNKLHQIGGAYFDRPIHYASCFEDIKTGLLKGQDYFREACRRVMCYHSSTRERLQEIDQFYLTILADLHPIHSVIDLACGLNPLALSWMGLPNTVEYFAVDIYKDMIQFIQQYMDLVGLKGTALVGDIIDHCPDNKADVAFLLKTIPCLEQVDKSAGVKILDQIQADHVIVSFPVHSLGGRRGKGMTENYTQRMNYILEDRQWNAQKYEFQTELVFVVRKFS